MSAMKLLLAFACLWAAQPAMAAAQSTTDVDLLTIDNGAAKIGMDRAKGGAITWLSSAAYRKNIINSADPGRLIQQSYYAGRNLDRQSDGQSKAWSPWPWNPIQGGGVGSWARVTEFTRLADHTLYAETVPKLWDMPNEEAAALLRQWTGFEPDMPDVLVIRCELVCRRSDDDRWGAARTAHQEVPACYFTRNFSQFKSYLGDGQWRDETQPPGPPWGKAGPPRKAIGLLRSRRAGCRRLQSRRHATVELRSPRPREQRRSCGWPVRPSGSTRSRVPRSAIDLSLPLLAARWQCITTRRAARRALEQVFDGTRRVNNTLNM
jgi:hypothetical protein